MKKNKIIGALIAAAGVVVSVGTALALYTKPVRELELTIGSATHTSSKGVVTYKINNNESPTVDPSYYTSGATHNSGEYLGQQKNGNFYNCAKYEYLLGASFAQDIQAQTYVMGNLSVSLTQVAELLQGKVQVSMYFEGYDDGTIGKAQYGSNLASNEVAINETIISGSSFTVDTRDICVTSSGVQKLVIYFELLDTVDYVALDESSSLWNLSVTWGAPVNFDAAYVANTATGFEEDDEFMMVPYIDKLTSEAPWEWIAQIKGRNDLTQAKCRQNSNWQSGDNATIELGVVYDVYWRGGEDGEYPAYFNARTSNQGA